MKDKKKNHIRLSYDQLEMLEFKFTADPNWSQKLIYDLANVLGLPYVKVYKWHYERKKKESRLASLMN